MSISTADAHLPRERVLCFDGGCNFRDLGGYRTEDGRTIRWGRVYRAGVLSYFTSDDHGALQRLGVRAICDLRRAEERAHEPTRWPADALGATPAVLDWEDSSAIPTIRGFAARRPQTAAGMFDSMVELYRALPAWMSGRIRGLFECIAHGNVPLVVHCAAGKDRTGIAVAVLLGALGVPRETIIEDYLLTNEAGDFQQFIRTRHQARLGLTDVHNPLLAMPEDMRRVLFSAAPQFLQAAFEQIDALGGLDAYLEGTAGISAATRAGVQQALLERL